MLFYNLISLQDAYPLLSTLKGPPILFPTCSTHYQPNVLKPSITYSGLWFGSILCIQHLSTPGIIALQIMLILKHPCHVLCITSISLSYTCLSRSSWIAMTTYTNPYRGGRTGTRYPGCSQCIVSVSRGACHTRNDGAI
jgi:hypothetical protein